MGFETQPSNASPPCAYVTAPTSPNECNTTEFYYSAPVSPRRKPDNPIETNGDHHPSSNLDDFEFETSKKFSGHLQFESSDHFEYYEGKNYQAPLPAMAFADELFLNGLVMPLKLPPRLQYDSDCNTSFSHKSSASSPRTVCKKISFARKSSRNDGFDPFMVALQKVREEKRGRNSRPQRRSRSYSPFRAMARCSSDCTYYINQDFSEENSPTEQMQVKAPSFSGPLDFKGSAYARWVRDQRLSANSPRRLLLGERVRPLRNDQEGPDKHAGPDDKKYVGNKYGNAEESKMQKLKGFLMRYALFGRGTKQTKTRSEKKKPKYYSRLGFKSKENAQSNGKRVEHRPSVALCLGYGVEHPGEVK